MDTTRRIMKRSIVKRGIVGIDPSLTATGVCTADGEMLTIKTKTTEYELTARLERLNSIVNQIVAHCTDADLVVIEAPSLGQKQQAGVVDRFGLWWMIVDAVTNLGVPIVDVAPKTLKKYATDNGNANKALMRDALIEHAEIDCKDDNQVDAWWLRAVGFALFDEPLVEITSPTALAALDVLRKSSHQ